MRRLPASRVRAFLDEEAPAPVAGDTEVHWCMANLVVERSAVLAFISAWWARWPLCEGRFIVPGAQLEATRVTMGRIRGRDELTRARATRRWKAELCWRPTDDQVQAVANAINRRASDPPAVIVTRKGLNRP